jgi:hypothetical protein
MRKVNSGNYIMLFRRCQGLSHVISDDLREISDGIDDDIDSAIDGQGSLMYRWAPHSHSQSFICS